MSSRICSELIVYSLSENFPTLSLVHDGVSFKSLSIKTSFAYIF